MKVMLMRENEQLVQNKKNSQAKLDVYKHKTTIREKKSGVCFYCVLSCTMDTVHDDVGPNNIFIVPEFS